MCVVTELEQQSADVVIVGAGYAGLAAASRLSAAGLGVVVLEAADRVGGRAVSEVLSSGVRVDHGAQWIGPSQKRFHELAAQFECATFPAWETGRHVEVWHDGTRADYSGTLPKSGPGIAEHGRVTALLDELALTVDLDQPWLTPNFDVLDSMSAEEFFGSQTDDEDALRRLALVVQGVWCCEPREISLFHVLFSVASAGGCEQLAGTSGSARDSRFSDGADALALAMAAPLTVRLDEPVLTIRHTADGVEVVTGKAVVRARRAIVTVPPAALGRIGFEPALPPVRRGWTGHTPMGRVAKVHAVYEEPFWRKKDRSGIATLYGRNPVGAVFDNSPQDASRGVLVAFVHGDRVDRWAAAPDDVRRADVLAALAEVAGARARMPVDYAEMAWSEDGWTIGGYACFVYPGGWTQYGEHGWRAAIGTVHWAGTETASVWNGHVDGALTSGDRAADEVIAALRS
ncbi:monoamine oxidase [Lentzea flaviverrucosa]|uniref:Monoamine oxidase n=1 Tax=Lentzea flaviverrucosa TaxID=200379 RepID=A0A1H9A6G9_9PSEU|nr:monoamine oxidase [Lentzea flaviverrucosa]SEP72259.1 monoamine oxidase [Lentzea flaviverrucosa]